MKKVILVTGASSGIGLLCAKALHEAGHIVYGSSRNITKMKSVPFIPIELDVTDDASVDAAVKLITKAQGKIDVLFNNAGNGVAGPAYAMPIPSAKNQFEVCFFGMVRISNAVLKGMIERKDGLIINSSSIAGLFGLPYVSMYCAAKAAVEGYSQSLRMELRGKGINVTVLNLGDYKTGFTDSREKVPFLLNNDILEKEYATVMAKIENDESVVAPEPEIVAKNVCKIVAMKKPAHSYLIGAFSQTISVHLKKVLPGPLFEKLLNDYYDLK